MPNQSQGSLQPSTDRSTGVMDGEAESNDDAADLPPRSTFITLTYDCTMITFVVERARIAVSDLVPVARVPSTVPSTLEAVRMPRRGDMAIMQCERLGRVVPLPPFEERDLSVLGERAISRLHRIRDNIEKNNDAMWVLCTVHHHLYEESEAIWRDGYAEHSRKKGSCYTPDS